MDGTGRLLRLVVTPGQRGDAPLAGVLLDGLRPRHVIADAAYDGDAIRRAVRRVGARARIRPNPTRKTRKRKKRCDRRRYRRRNVIGRFFRRVKQCRRVATRYEKKAANFAGFVWPAAFVTGGI